MTRFTLLRSTALAGLAMLPATAHAQNVSFWDLFTAERLGIGMVQSLVGLGRSVAEIRYVDLDIRPLDNRAMISGLTIAPYDQERNPGCEVNLDQLVLSGASLLQTDLVAVNIEISGASMPVTCLDPWDRDELIALGIDNFAIEHGDIRFELMLASGAASMAFDLHSPGYGSVSGEIEFDYLSVNIDTEEPIADLTSAYLEFVDDGLWALFSAEIPPFMTNEDMLVAMMSEELLPSASAPPAPPAAEEVAPPADGGKPGDGAAAPAPAPAPPPAPAPAPVADPAIDAARATVENLAAAVAGFANDPGRIAVTVMPETPVRLTEDLFEDFAPFVAALNPQFEHGPSQPALAAPEMAEALSAALTGGDITDDARRSLGLMLLSGEGMPRSPALAIDVMAPLLEAGDAEALGALSDHYDLVAPEQVYGFLHAAAAGGNTRAALALDRAERRLGLAGVLAAQGDSQVALTGSEEASELAEMARSALSGVGGTGRHYHDAYLLALLAEAGGARSASFIIDSLDDRSRVSDDPELWATMLDDARDAALLQWLAANTPDAEEPEPEAEAETDQ